MQGDNRQFTSMYSVASQDSEVIEINSQPTATGSNNERFSEEDNKETRDKEQEILNLTSDEENPREEYQEMEVSNNYDTKNHNLGDDTGSHQEVINLEELTDEDDDEKSTESGRDINSKESNKNIGNNNNEHTKSINLDVQAIKLSSSLTLENHEDDFELAKNDDTVEQTNPQDNSANDEEDDLEEIGETDFKKGLGSEFGSDELNSEDEIPNLEEDESQKDQLDRLTNKLDNENSVIDDRENDGNSKRNQDDDIAYSKNNETNEFDISNDVITIEESTAPPMEENKDKNSLDDIPMPIFIRISGDDYLLIPFYKPTKLDLEGLVALFDDSSVLGQSTDDFFGSLRDNEDLVDLYNFEENEELILIIPELGNLSITEDNIYSRDIGIWDFVKAFMSLKMNSKDDTSVPPRMTLEVSTQRRFITKFNKLAESVNSGKGFNDIEDLNNPGELRLSSKRSIEFEEDVNESHKKQKTSI